MKMVQKVFMCARQKKKIRYNFENKNMKLAKQNKTSFGRNKCIDEFTNKSYKKSPFLLGDIFANVTSPRGPSHSVIPLS
jgi:hypothetical protein